MKLNKREQGFAIAVGFFLALFALQKTIVAPFLEKLRALNGKIEFSEKKFEKLLYIESQKENIAAEFSNVQRYIEPGKSQEDVLGVMMKTIEELAKGSGISLLNMTPDTAGKKKGEEGPQKTQKVTLNVDGSQKNVITFLYKLENSSYPLTIKKLDLKVKDRESGLTEAGMDVEFVYFL